MDLSKLLIDPHARTITLGLNETAVWVGPGVWERMKHARNRASRADGLITTDEILARSLFVISTAVLSS